MKVELTADIGRILLNSRDGLIFLEDSPSRIVATGLKSKVANAIRGVLYRIDSVINIISGNSKYLFQNSQHLGSTPDFLRVTLNDQGNFGENGFSEYASTAAHKNGLIINITIAAVNNAPSISMGNSYTAYENRPYSVAGISVNDIDVDEVITSQFAKELWLGYLYNLPYENKIKITAQLNGYNNGVARGLIYINSDGSNLYLVSNGSHVFINVSSTFVQSHACSFQDAISRPGSYQCEQDTPASGILCMGSWDNITCRRIGGGRLQFVNDSNTRFHITDFSSSLLPYLNNVSAGVQIEFGVVTSGGLTMLGEVSAWDANSSDITLGSASTDIRGLSGGIIQWQMYLKGAYSNCTYQGPSLAEVCISAAGNSLFPAQVPCSGEASSQTSCEMLGNGRLQFVNDSNTRFHITDFSSSLLPYLNNVSAGVQIEFGVVTSGGLTMLGEVSAWDANSSDITLGSASTDIRGLSGGIIQWQMYLKNTFCTIPQPCGCKVIDMYTRISCSNDSDCGFILNNSSCGCQPTFPVCGPFKSGESYDIRLGQPCTYRGVKMTQNGKVTMHDSLSCISPIFAIEGTSRSEYVNQILFSQSLYDHNELSGRGSTRIEFYSPLLYAQAALQSLIYLTYNPEFPNYNRLYRLPKDERNPATFNINADDFDKLSVTANDMGNSGGGARVENEVTSSMQIITMAVNNPPEIHAPSVIAVREDVPYSILTRLDASPPLHGIFLTDPDQNDYGFNDSKVTLEKTLGFAVNLSVDHGCIFVNENFLQYGHEYAGRNLTDALGNTIYIKVGDSQCSLIDPFATDGCTIRLLDYGQPKEGLHAVKCISQCTSVTFAPCYSATPPTVDRHCYGRGCAKFLAFEGRFADINNVLSNITYVSDPNFNTHYGVQESLLIQVTDNGILGDPPDIPHRAQLRIPIVVEPVNDAPIIGRLQNAQCIDYRADGTYDLSLLYSETRFFSISSVDSIDVNEDTEFTLMPDRLWISDPDAEEATIRSRTVSHCAGPCGLVINDKKRNCCVSTSCPYLCKKIETVTPGGIPSDVIVYLSVSNGKLSFYPPPTYYFIPEIVFLTNISKQIVENNASNVQLCTNQLACMKNQTELWIRTRLPYLQKALSAGYLRYIGNQNYNGDDNLNIWVYDNGYSDVTYTNPRSSSASLAIQIVAVNDPPAIQHPGGPGCSCNPSSGMCSCSSTPPLLYASSDACMNDWMKYGFSDPWPSGRGLDCTHPNLSSIPNTRSTYSGYKDLSTKIVFSDVDINQGQYANLTVDLSIARPGAGDFQIRNLLSTVIYYQYEDNAGRWHMVMQGTISDINSQMDQLYFNPNPTYSGPSPFEIVANDNNNWGICTPRIGAKPYRCNRDKCFNPYSGNSYGHYFFCGRPVASDVTDFGFFPGASFACESLLPAEPAVLYSGSNWSGPWSCLGCGSYDIFTQSIKNSNQSNPSLPGVTRVIVDATVGSSAACQFSDCVSCNSATKAFAGPHADGCGWCPSFCGGAGKCMIGKAMPIFEACPTDVATGRSYRQCSASSSSLILDLAVALPTATLGLYLIYALSKWMQRRHGSMVVYLKRKQLDFILTGRKLYLLPPDGAHYREFFIMIIVTVIAGIFFSGVLTQPGGPYDYHSSFYLDSLTSLSMTVDSCNLRFLPTRIFPYPTNLISALKVRLAFPIDQKIVLASNSCSAAATLSLLNNMPAATKYRDYYCNIQFIIPDRYVFPRLSIQAVGNNMTTVRGGPMDPDTKNFGIDFGANEFIMQGDYLSARLDNISAKHLKYDVLHGTLVATNVSNTPYGTFKSIDADMIVTSPNPTTVWSWQKSANMVCLSASTLFVDSACSEQCGYPNPVEMPTGLSDVGASNTIHRYYRRRSLLSTSCTGVPAVPGCVNPDCTYNQSKLCLCKPNCDMIPASQLSYDGVSGVRGSCNDLGQCCRMICQGYSLADMFPYPNSVRCGACVAATSCSPPTCGSWTSGNLEQQWWFTSDQGQISVTVAAQLESNQTLQNSYNGSLPQGGSISTINLDLRDTDKQVLNAEFHAGGSSAPSDQIVWLSLYGPGAPLSTDGDYAWIKDVRYLVLPEYFLKAVSYSLLAPKKRLISLGLMPGFCPPFLASNDPAATTRQVALQQLLLNTIQEYPANVATRPIPQGSEVVWVPVTGSPAKFVLDPSTSQYLPTVISMWTGAGPSMYTLLLLSIFVPMAASLVATFGLLRAGRSFLQKFREKALEKENTYLNIYEQAKFDHLPFHEQVDRLEIPAETRKEMTGRTSFFFVIDQIFMFSERTTLINEAFRVLIHLTIITTPAGYIYYVSSHWKTAYLTFQCRYTISQGECLSQTEVGSMFLNYMLLVYTLVALTELSAYYLKFPYLRGRAILRGLFYCTVSAIICFSLLFLLLSTTWIMLGMLLLPSIVAPYFIAEFMISLILLSYIVKLVRFRARVSVHTRRRLELFKKSLVPRFPSRVVDVVVEMSLEAALKENGLSYRGIVLNTVGLITAIVMIYSFILVGFKAFSADGSSGLLDSILILLVSLGMLSSINSENKREQVEESTRAMSDRVLEATSSTLSIIQDQLHVAEKMIKSQQHLEDPKEEELPRGMIVD
ncbi:hypothetical protein GUITHDRAFT_113453 [Guillardia theta CCMP2712]|uniref:Uncharacterized protein n=2 Tax=Guillardia theta TaxID=55529 RepID=L1IX17_GUITC|nr:hypothetical protein GUITHDRAFT_113453 [Guillardia theta CCMP2712]EKX40424.1 hypothetical protein GUITHDRAFT_113453 [Guillardia theta CCMP2712]|eukprot:XP_005827404.1 hypothetical protein GUITHDRAFT_113453 [Guillardia theta CCMP2712]